jgi:putative MATE family efflux protein
MKIFSRSTKLDGSMLFSSEALRRLIIPLILEQFLASTIGVADSIMVASVGEAAVSGISLVDSINILLINVFAALATGGAVVTAQYLGRKEPEMAGQAAKQLLYTVLAISIVITVFSLIFRNFLLAFIYPGIAPDVTVYAQVYFLITALSFPFLSIYNGSAALMRSIGNSQVSLNTSLLMNAVNIGGNALLIYVFHMGVAGAAIATLASRIMCAVIMLVILKKPHDLLHVPSLRKLEWNGAMIKRILHVGVPNGLENSLFQVGKILIQSLVATLGTIAIAANAVASNLAGFLTIPGSAVGLAMITVVGRCVGAKEFKQARQYVFRLMRMTYLSMLVLTGILLLLRPYIISIYHLSAETANLTSQLIYIYSLVCILLWPTSFSLPNALRAAGDARFTMVVSALSMLLFRMAFSYLLVLQFHMGVLGIWIAMMIDWLTRSAAFVVRYLSGRWERKNFL